jgi:hypothetical protein
MLAYQPAAQQGAAATKVCDMRSDDGTTGDPELDIIQLSRDHMVDHPAGAHYVLWNGPAFLDVGVPAGGFVRFAVADLTTQWTLLADAQGQPLPVAARSDGGGLAIWWLPYDGPVPRPAAQTGRGLSDAEYAAALENLSATRYRGLMDAAWGIGGWSTYRPR